MRLYRILNQSICLVLVLSTCFLASCKNESKDKTSVVRPVKTIVIGGKKTTIDRQFPGKVYANKEVDLAFQVEGKLMAYPVEEGKEVKKGHLIGQLEKEKYIDAVARAKTRLNLTTSQFGRGKKLIEDAFISEAEFDKLKTDMEVSQTELSNAERDLGWTTMSAPFDGVIAKKYVDLFEFIKPKQPIVRLQAIANIDIKVNIPEDIIINVKKDGSAKPEVSFPGAPDHLFPVVFKEYVSEADQETQTYEVTFTLPKPEGINVLPGMSATIHVQLPDFKSGSGNFVLLPSAAVFVDAEEKPAVWVVKEDSMTLEKLPVKTGRVLGDDIQVTGGLKKDMRVVVAGVHYLKEGQKVKLLDAKKDAE